MYHHSQHPLNNGGSINIAIRGAYPESLSDLLTKKVNSWAGSYDLHTFMQTQLNGTQGFLGEYLVGYFAVGNIYYIYLHKSPDLSEFTIEDWIKGGFGEEQGITSELRQNISNVGYFYL